MLPPKLKVNSFMEKDKSSEVDPISKMFIKMEAIFGLNRIAVLDDCSSLQKAIIGLYDVLAKITIILLFYFIPVNEWTIYIDLTEYLFLTIFSFITYKRIKLYLSEINNFDKQVATKPITKELIKMNIVLHGIFVLVTISVIFLNTASFRYHMMPVHMVHVFELYFYGHLFSLIYPRIRLLNCYIEVSLNSNDIGASLKAIGYSYTPSSDDQLLHSKHVIKNLTDLYQIIIGAHKYLIDAMKWQFVVVLMLSFVACLVISYDMALLSLGPNPVSMMDIAIYVSVTFGTTFSLFAPCIYGDQLYGQVRRLRMLLASRLYGNKLDKSERGVARALLAMTEEHNLSLSLLGMIKVDISLPVKFISLLVTYLIIMLQFQKVLRG